MNTAVERFLKGAIVLLAVVIFVLSMLITNSVFATSSPSVKEVWLPVASHLGEVVVAADQSYEHLLSGCTRIDDGTIAVGGFAAEVFLGG